MVSKLMSRHQWVKTERPALGASVRATAMESQTWTHVKPVVRSGIILASNFTEKPLLVATLATKSLCVKRFALPDHSSTITMEGAHAEHIGAKVRLE
jgi:hypothetical protein